MAATPLIAAQAKGSTTLSTLYTHAGAGTGFAGTINITNLSTSQRTARVALSKSGAAIDGSHYILYGVPVPVGNALNWPVSGLSTGDIVRIWASSTHLAFVLAGVKT